MSVGKTWEVIDMRQKESATMEGLGYTQTAAERGFFGDPGEEEVKTHLDTSSIGRRGLKTTQVVAHPSFSTRSAAVDEVDELFQPKRSISPGSLTTATSPPTSFADRVRRPSPISPPPTYDHTARQASPTNNTTPHSPGYRMSAANTVHDKLYRQALKRQDNRWRGIPASVHDREFHDTLRTTPIAALRRPKAYKVGWGAGGLKTDAWEWRNPHKSTPASRRTKSAPITANERDHVWERLHGHGEALKRQKQQLRDTHLRHDKMLREKRPIDRCYDLVGSTFGTRQSKVDTQRVLASAGPSVKEVQPRVYNHVSTWNRLHTNTTRHTRTQTLKLTENKPPPKFVKPKKIPKRMSRPDYERASMGQGTASPPRESVASRPSYPIPIATGQHHPIMAKTDQPGWTRETDPVSFLQPQPHVGQVETKLLDETTIQASARKHYKANGGHLDSDDETTEEPSLDAGIHDHPFREEPVPKRRLGAINVDPPPVVAPPRKSASPFPPELQSDSEEDLAN
eukprot:TRINITY_DN6739_c0_g1_i1.p1 TRINITY_DN6739_c0_g1~~TRINITY_DN6739_c0_g1_i1.p1  ORF type:complete len:544 (+),score=124.79 TRINITY_DN6739_c0_g1_i1:98-1633(+)